MTDREASSTGGYLRSLRLSRQDLARSDRPRTFTMFGREWDLLDGVFAPVFRPSTAASVDFLGLRHHPDAWRGRTFLEMGSGSGVVAVMAALAGCARVVGADINPEAVRNTARNAERHGVSDRCTAVRSDLFGGLAAGDRFDVVFWNSNFIPAPEDYAFRTMHERAFVDPGYEAHSRFLAEAPGRLTKGGLVLLLFSSSKGDLAALRRIAGKCGRGLEVLRRDTFPDGNEVAEAEYLLLEVTDGGASGVSGTS